MRTNKRVNKTLSSCSIQVFSDLSNVAKSKRSAATNTADVRFEVQVFKRKLCVFKRKLCVTRPFAGSGCLSFFY